MHFYHSFWKGLRKNYNFINKILKVTGINQYNYNLCTLFFYNNINLEQSKHKFSIVFFSNTIISLSSEQT
jgi:hypothetical protein